MGCNQSIPVADTKLQSIQKMEPHPEIVSEDGSSRLTRGNSSDSIPSTQIATSSSSSSKPVGGGTFPSESPNAQFLDIDAAVEDLNKRAALGAGYSDVETEDPFADDCSAVFEVEEDTLFNDNLSIGSAAAQEALRGLTLEAKLSIVELVRSNSINQIAA